MRNYFYAVIIIASCIVLTNCGGDRVAERQLHEADAVMNSDPDSALCILTSMKTGGLSEEQRVRHGLMLTKASDKSYKTLDNDTLISAAVEYYAGRGDSLEVQSLFYQGYYYSEKRINDKALVTLHEAYEKAVASGDEFYAGMSAREMWAIYRRLFMLEESLKWARLAEEYFRRAGKPLHAAWMGYEISDGLIYTGKYDQAKEVLDSMDRSEYAGERNFHINILRNRIDLAMEQSCYEDVLTLYDSLSCGDYSFTANERLDQAKASLKTGDAEDCERYLSLARELPMIDTDSLYAGKLEAELYALRNEYRKAYEASHDYSDHLKRSDLKLLMNPDTQLLTENLRLTTEIQRLQLAKKTAGIIWSVIFCAMMGILIVVIFYYHRSALKRKELEKARMIDNLETLREDLTFSRERLSLLNNRYNQQLEETVSLRKSIEGQDKYFKDEVRKIYARKIDILNRVAEICYHTPGGIKEKGINKELRSLLKSVTLDNQAEELRELIDKYFGNWMTNFKNRFPYLTAEEYNLVMYYLVGFHTQTIAVLTDRINLSTLYTAKSRLKKKLLDRCTEEERKMIEKIFDRPNNDSIWTE